MILVVFLGARAISIVIPVFVGVGKVHVEADMHYLPEFVLLVPEISCSEAFCKKDDHKMSHQDAEKYHKVLLQIHPRVQIDLWWGGIVWVLGIVPTVQGTPFDILLETMEMYLV